MIVAYTRCLGPQSDVGHLLSDLLQPWSSKVQVRRPDSLSKKEMKRLAWSAFRTQLMTYSCFPFKLQVCRINHRFINNTNSWIRNNCLRFPILLPLWSRSPFLHLAFLLNICNHENINVNNHDLPMSNSYLGYYWRLVYKKHPQSWENSRSRCILLYKGKLQCAPNIIFTLMLDVKLLCILDMTNHLI